MSHESAGLVEVIWSEKGDPSSSPHKKSRPCSTYDAKLALTIKGYKECLPLNGEWIKSVQTTEGGPSHNVGYARLVPYIKPEPLENLP